MKNLLELLTLESINTSELLTVVSNYIDKEVSLLHAERLGNYVIISLINVIDNSRILINGLLTLGDKRLTITAINN